MIEYLISRYQYLIDNNLFNNPYYITKDEEEKDILEKIEQLKLKLTK